MSHLHTKHLTVRVPWHLRPHAAERGCWPRHGLAKRRLGERAKARRLTGLSPLVRWNHLTRPIRWSCWIGPIVSTHHIHHVPLRIGVALFNHPHIIAELIRHLKNLLEILPLKLDGLTGLGVKSCQSNGALESISNLTAIPNGAELRVELSLEDLVRTEDQVNGINFDARILDCLFDVCTPYLNGLFLLERGVVE